MLLRPIYLLRMALIRTVTSALSLLQGRQRKDCIHSHTGRGDTPTESAATQEQAGECSTVRFCLWAVRWGLLTPENRDPHTLALQRGVHGGSLCLWVCGWDLICLYELCFPLNLLGLRVDSLNGPEGKLRNLKPSFKTKEGGPLAD